ncbi:fluoride efflux transporter CrcB [Nitrosomonas sp.]|uniref:fluoride efflux transporter CrcB n=1 Tax=Nitrosomonas sp. TaxID=42353 RepID=UPI0025CBE56A|nr:fluoride efflux transporter CrcB [Nitrosomonas sp.]
MEAGVLIRSLLAISLGASLGAILRWGLGMAFNALFPTIPPGTWLANMLGGYLIGLALAYFGQHAGLSPEWRLFIITGFLGGLTTFSTFSAEVTALIQQERLLWAGVAVSVHVGGSLLMTLLGLATYEIGRHL